MKKSHVTKWLLTLELVSSKTEMVETKLRLVDCKHLSLGFHPNYPTF